MLTVWTQEEVQAALQKVRRDIEVTCETLLEEQMKLRGKVAVALKGSLGGELVDGSGERGVPGGPRTVD